MSQHWGYSGYYDERDPAERGEDGEHAHERWRWGEEAGHHMEPPDDEVDDWPDPDHGREDHRMGAVLRQSEQYATRLAWGDKLVDSSPHKEPATHPPAVRNDDVHIMRGEESGLYGQDEDHPYDAIVRPSGHGPKSYDVLKPLD